MCGIIGYTGKKQAKEVILSGLKNLEYRGYDSAGIALKKGTETQLFKSSGKISNLEEKLKRIDINSNIGIGHTRWATHGAPNETNAHPHKVGNVTLVHNGIIENYQELKIKLEKLGVKFKSQTDTEVACAYINYMYEKTILQFPNSDKLGIIIDACKDFRGSYAFGILFDGDSKIYVARKDSPLIIGVGENENFIASDVSAILEYTKEYILLESDEFAKISNNSVKVVNKDGNYVSKKINVATWTANEYQKNGYEHFMLKEIHEEPKVIENVFNRYFKDNYFESSIKFKNYNKIQIVACGSAMHAGLVGKYLFENYALIPVEVEIASEYRYKKQLITKNTLVIIISQSGETADTLAALRIAKQKKATTLSIVNAVGSTIAREADYNIYTQAGPEIAVATTKGYTTQVAVLSCLCLNSMEEYGILNPRLKSQIYSDFKNISSLIEKIIQKQEKLQFFSNMIVNKNDVFFIGRGIDYALCMEGSLKLKEISYIHSEAYAAGELKHGTISLIENGTCVIAITSDKDLYEKTVSNIKEVKARGAKVILISSIKEDSSDFADALLLLKQTSKFTEPLLIAVVLQLIAYNVANKKGCDIDKPKNLAKSVTVE